MRKPNLFIIGAPKCGTTTISEWLKQHPNVYFSPTKEPHHFYSPYGPTMSLEVYEALFSNAKNQHTILAEASVWYLFSGFAIDRILEYNPDARFIVCLRNPVEMAQSLHAQKIFTGHEKLRDFDAAWAVGEQRSQGKRIGIFGIREGDPRHMSYQQAASLGTQVFRLLDKVNREQVMFIWLDEISRSPDQVWERICIFLDIERGGGIQYVYANPATKRKSLLLHRVFMFVGMIKARLRIRKSTGILAPLYQFNIERRKYRGASPEIRCEMEDYFRTEVSLLNTLCDTQDRPTKIPMNKKK